MFQFLFLAKTPGEQRAMTHAMETGKINRSYGQLSGLASSLEKLLGMKVDISFIKIGGAFDNGAQIQTNAAVPTGVR
jgi:hypothetical protein